MSPKASLAYQASFVVSDVSAVGASLLLLDAPAPSSPSSLFSPSFLARGRRGRRGRSLLRLVLVDGIDVSPGLVLVLVGVGPAVRIMVDGGVHAMQCSGTFVPSFLRSSLGQSRLMVAWSDTDTGSDSGSGFCAARDLGSLLRLLFSSLLFSSLLSLFFFFFPDFSFPSPMMSPDFLNFLFCRFCCSFAGFAACVINFLSRGRQLRLPAGGGPRPEERQGQDRASEPTALNGTKLHCTAAGGRCHSFPFSLASRASEGSLRKELPLKD